MILTWPQSNVIRRNLLVFCIYTFMFMSERVMHKRNLHIWQICLWNFHLLACICLLTFHLQFYNTNDHHNRQC
jgi:Ca2+/Na+ antiporter